MFSPTEQQLGHVKSSNMIVNCTSSSKCERLFLQRSWNYSLITTEGTSYAKSVIPSPSVIGSPAQAQAGDCWNSEKEFKVASAMVFKVLRKYLGTAWSRAALILQFLSWMLNNHLKTSGAEKESLRLLTGPCCLLRRPDLAAQYFLFVKLQHTASFSWGPQSQKGILKLIKKSIL